ncbi:MAG: cell division protein CrgA [Propioniciclava sp.]
MPESKGRKRAEHKQKAARMARTQEERAENRRGTLAERRNWVVPTFITCGILGVLWLVVWYITAATGIAVPFMSDLGNWNMLIGMGLITAAFALSTLWK